MIAVPLGAHHCPRYDLDNEIYVAFDARGNGDGQTASAVTGDHERRITDYTTVAFQLRYYTRDNKPGGQPSDTADITNCHKAGDSAPHVMAFQPRYTRNGRGAPGTIAAPLTAEAGRTGRGDSAQCVVFDYCAQGSERTRVVRSGEYAQMIAGRPDAIAHTWGIRRLTPTECERLQGFDDGWTVGQSDSARYRQLGNAVCVPVAEWLGQRIGEFRRIE